MIHYSENLVAGCGVFPMKSPKGDFGYVACGFNRQAKCHTIGCPLALIPFGTRCEKSLEPYFDPM